MWVASLQCASVDLRPAGWSAGGDSIQQPHHALPLPKGSPSSIKGSNLLEELYTRLFNKLNANYNITGKTTTFDSITQPKMATSNGNHSKLYVDTGITVKMMCYEGVD